MPKGKYTRKKKAVKSEPYILVDPKGKVTKATLEAKSLRGKKTVAVLVYTEG